MSVVCCQHAHSSLSSFIVTQLKYVLFVGVLACLAKCSVPLDLCLFCACSQVLKIALDTTSHAVQACTVQGTPYTIHQQPCMLLKPLQNFQELHSFSRVHAITSAHVKPVCASQVKQLHDSSMLASPSIPLHPGGATAHSNPSKTHAGDESAQHSVRISKLTEELEQVKADKEELLNRLSSTQQSPPGENEDRVAELGMEIAQLKRDNQLLVGRLGTAEQQLAEARSAVDQKEGHLQGLQVSVVVCHSLSSLQACILEDDGKNC